MTNRSDLIGHADILEYLKNSLKNDSLAHAYLFLGPQGIGRMKLLEDFLPDILPAGSLKHPDVRLVRAESDSDVITISQIRELRAWLALSPLVGKKKITVIDGAEKMNQEAQNGFLKVLEEPVNQTYIFLLGSHPKALLPTIYSRLVPIYFNPVPLPELQKLAARLGLDNQDCLESHGCPGYLIKKSQGQNNDTALIDEILSRPGPSERLRFFMQAKLEKEAIRPWLQSLAPVLRRRLLTFKEPVKSVKIIRQFQEALSRPMGQNWQLIAENLIISL